MRDFIVRESRLSEKERRNLSILDSIRRGVEISRADISKETDLNIVTVSNYVSKYIKNKLVFETGLDISTGGRRPELLKLNSHYGYSIGIDLGSPHITPDSSVVGVLMDLSGKVLAEEKVIKGKESFDQLTAKVVDMIKVLAGKADVAISDIKGIGVGIWGVIDRYKGMVRYPIEDEQIISYVNLVNELRSTFNIPAFVEHDAALGAFGEKWAGAGAGSTAENLIFLCSDSSCGIVIRGELYYGATRSAGELNINPPYPGEKSDPANCWTNYDYGCCLRSRGIDLGVPSRAKKYLNENPEVKSIILEMAGGETENITFNMVVAAAGKSDKTAIQIIEEAGNYLGAKIAFLINLFNPEVVVIGRGIELGGDIFFSSVRKSVRKWAYEESVKVAKILPTSLKENVVAIGAGALVIQDLFAKI
ncbi:MAG: ROK family protein [Candidatus Omnitrophota bacterium]